MDPSSRIPARSPAPPALQAPPVAGATTGLAPAAVPTPAPFNTAAARSAREQSARAMVAWLAHDPIASLPDQLVRRYFLPTTLPKDTQPWEWVHTGSALGATSGSLRGAEKKLIQDSPEYALTKLRVQEVAKLQATFPLTDLEPNVLGTPHIPPRFAKQFAPMMGFMSPPCRKGSVHKALNLATEADQSAMIADLCQGAHALDDGDCDKMVHHVMGMQNENYQIPALVALVRCGACRSAPQRMAVLNMALTMQNRTLQATLMAALGSEGALMGGPQLSQLVHGMLERNLDPQCLSKAVVGLADAPLNSELRGLLVNAVLNMPRGEDHARAIAVLGAHGEPGFGALLGAASAQDHASLKAKAYVGLGKGLLHPNMAHHAVNLVDAVFKLPRNEPDNRALAFAGMWPATVHLDRMLGEVYGFEGEDLAVAMAGLAKADFNPGQLHTFIEKAAALPEAEHRSRVLVALVQAQAHRMSPDQLQLSIDALRAIQQPEDALSRAKGIAGFVKAAGGRMTAAQHELMVADALLTQGGVARPYAIGGVSAHGHVGTFGTNQLADAACSMRPGRFNVLAFVGLGGAAEVMEKSRLQDLFAAAHGMRDKKRSAQALLCLVCPGGITLEQLFS
jgi:hypothetical protein